MDLAKKSLIDSHPIEKKMGILYYATKNNGIGGKLRNTPLDFRVEEILPDGRIIRIDDLNFKLGENEPGLFTEFILIKKNIESHTALMRISSALKRNLNDIDVSGTKDKMAYTAQRATIWRVSPEQLLNLELGGIRIRSPRTVIYKTFLGDLKGNNFTIKVNGSILDHNEITNCVENIHKEIISLDGIPNFFGHQRFGSRRPVSHIIGRLVIQNKIRDAIEFYLGHISEDESETVKEARQVFLDTNDPNEMIKILPKAMIFERLILNFLKQRSNDYIGAFHQLPKNLQRMFIHSYQSYIWNLTLSERLRLYQDLHPKKIDIIEDGELVLPIIGYRTSFPDNELFDYTKNLLEEDEINLEQFKVPIIPSLKFLGSNRSMVIKPQNFIYGIENDNENRGILITKFSLKSGSYATVVLREFMKTTPLNF